MIEIYLIAA